MPPRDSRGDSRRAARRLIAALAGSGIPALQLRNFLDGTTRLDGTTPVASLIEPVLSDPDRLQAVRATGLLGGADPDLDRAAALTATALGVPYAAVSLVDRDRRVMAGRHPSAPETDRSAPLGDSLCTFAVATGEPFIVDDARRNPLVADYAPVRSGEMLAYAGIPLADHDRNVIGALAAWDSVPRRWTTGQVQILTDYSAVVAAKIFGRGF